MLRSLFVILVVIMGALSVWMVVNNMSRILPMANGVDAYGLELPEKTEDDFLFHYSDAEQEMLDIGWVDICKVVPDIQLALAYASNQNFMDTVLYKNVKHAFAEPYTAGKLKRAQDLLRLQDSTMSLVILDAGRAQRIQYMMWDWAVKNDMQKYIAAPTLASNHNYGCAVDVTIARGDTVLDMGTSYDHFGPESEPRYHWQMLEQGKLTRAQIEHRLLLKSIMRQAGFQSIQTEWWHFNGVSKGYARAHFKLLK